MPYIKAEDRVKVDKPMKDLLEYIRNHAITSGELNYIITSICLEKILSMGINYENINSITGTLGCVKSEFYRRLASPYEDEKIKENGDVYPTEGR